MASLLDGFENDPDELCPEEEMDLVAEYIRACMDDLPARLLIHGQLFMRDGGGLYTNIEDADDDRIFEIDAETGQLCQWPDGD
jgi:hypothetical protein